MSEIQSFLFRGSRQFRVMFINERPWFEIADVKMVLNYRSMDEILKRLNNAEHIQLRVGQTKYILISEQGLYKLAPRAEIPSSRSLKEWVKNEVIALNYKR